MVVESVHVDLDTLIRISEKWRRVEEAKRLPFDWTRVQARYAISGLLRGGRQAQDGHPELAYVAHAQIDEEERRRGRSPPVACL